MGLRGVLFRENYVLSRVTKRLIENINKMSNKHMLVGDMALKLCYNVSNISTKNIELESTDKDELINIVDRFVNSRGDNCNIKKGLNEDLITINVKYDKPEHGYYYGDTFGWTQFKVHVKYKDKINKDELQNINGVLTYDKKYLAILEFEEAVRGSILNKIFCIAILFNNRVSKEKMEKVMKLLNDTNMKYYLDKDLGDETNPYCNTRASKIFGSAIFLSRDNSKEDIGKTLEALKGIKVNYMVAFF